ncbi:MAG: hypothetical protein KF744_14410 [Taibaiella sp.]|nr:hypothetical protein [Taibaiella sp.]
MKKGIFCLEGLWSSSVKDRSTIQPILELMDKRGICDHIHHSCATKEELVYFLNRFKSKSVQNKFPILYFGFHGEKECICLAGKVKFSLSELGETLKDSAKGKVLYFASCDTLDIDERKIKNLLEKTGAIAAIGYKVKIDWMQSTAFDLLVLDALQSDRFDWRGIQKIKEYISTEYGKLGNKLKFRMVINDRIHFPRKRK